MDRSSYRYEPRPDRNVELRGELVKLARQKPRYGYRRLHVLLERRGYAVNVKRVYRLYLEEGLRKLCTSWGLRCSGTENRVKGLSARRLLPVHACNIEAPRSCALLDLR